MYVHTSNLPKFCFIQIVKEIFFFAWLGNINEASVAPEASGAHLHGGKNIQLQQPLPGVLKNTA